MTRKAPPPGSRRKQPHEHTQHTTSDHATNKPCMALLHAVRSDVLTRREAVALISEQPELLELDFGAVHEDEQLLLVHKPFQERTPHADTVERPALHMPARMRRQTPTYTIARAVLRSA